MNLFDQFYPVCEMSFKYFFRFDIAVKYDPQFGDAYYFKGLSSEKLGNLENAIRDYKNAAANNNRFGRAEAALERLNN